MHNAFIERFNIMHRTYIQDFYLFRSINEERELTERWLAEKDSERLQE